MPEIRTEPREDLGRGNADRGTVLLPPDHLTQLCDFWFLQTAVRARETGLGARKCRVDALGEGGPLGLAHLWCGGVDDEGLTRSRHWVLLGLEV